jgi:hypothetical protein
MAAETERDQPAQPAPKRRTRLIIDISPELRRRIKIAAAERDLSVREYVEQILESTVAPQTEEAKAQRTPVSLQYAEQLRQFQEEWRRAHPGVVLDDSVDLIRQMREERTERLENAIRGE